MSFCTWLLVHLLVCPAVAQRFSRALYPSAYKIKRGKYSPLDPTFQRSQKDVDLLFEILLAGTQIEGGDGRLLVPDEELASLKQVKKLEVICEDVLPKTLSEVRRLVAQLSQRGAPQRGAPLRWDDYQSTVLTLVYISQTAARLDSEPSQQAWGDVLIQLFNALHKDLTVD
ncbi:protein FAM180A [Eucyclogobius newberryi]|uniref:protein FAM180A n=1 Tax=Eucyclogobius newberryi TaxID=166745 RepID=UPI003B5B78E2